MASEKRWNNLLLLYWLGGRFFVQCCVLFLFLCRLVGVCGSWLILNKLFLSLFSQFSLSFLSCISLFSPLFVFFPSFYHSFRLVCHTVAEVVCVQLCLSLIWALNSVKWLVFFSNYELYMHNGQIGVKLLFQNIYWLCVSAYSYCLSFIVCLR